MKKNLLSKAEAWWKKHVLHVKPTTKTARVKIKRKKDKSASEKERKATLKVLNGPFGRMDRLHDDIQ
jgi:hypothetical protein